MDLWLATTNSGKILELKQALSQYPFTIHTVNELRGFSAPPETGKTFVENALIKAKSLHAIKNTSWVLADDSGLIVDGLNGLPGVHSARYAGERASDGENTAKLLKMMQLRSPLQRTARFVCSIVAFSPKGEKVVCEGKMEGEIGKSQKGTAGFGYDPVFIPQGMTQTLAELTPLIKNQISHRAQALKQFLEFVRGLDAKD